MRFINMQTSKKTFRRQHVLKAVSIIECLRLFEIVCSFKMINAFFRSHGDGSYINLNILY